MSSVISTKSVMEGSWRQSRRPVPAECGRADAYMIARVRYQQYKATSLSSPPMPFPSLITRMGTLYDRPRLKSGACSTRKRPLIAAPGTTLALAYAKACPVTPLPSLLLSFIPLPSPKQDAPPQTHNHNPHLRRHRRLRRPPQQQPTTRKHRPFHRCYAHASEGRWKLWKERSE